MAPNTHTHTQRCSTCQAQHQLCYPTICSGLCCFTISDGRRMGITSVACGLQLGLGEGGFVPAALFMLAARLHQLCGQRISWNTQLPRCPGRCGSGRSSADAVAGPCCCCCLTLHVCRTMCDGSGAGSLQDNRLAIAQPSLHSVDASKTSSMQHEQFLHSWGKGLWSWSVAGRVGF